MRTGTSRVGRATMAVIGIGLALTATLTFAAARAHDANEDRLLRRQADEVTSVLQAAIPAITGEVNEMARVSALLAADPARLRDELATDVAEGQRFVAVTVMLGSENLASAGVEPALTAEGRAAVLQQLDAEPETMEVTGLLTGDEPRIAYSTSAPGEPDVVVIAEQRLTQPRIREDREGQSFQGIDFAIYLGEGRTMDDLVSASSTDLPLGGRRAERTVPFGDETLRFVVSPRGILGGWLLAALPWLTGTAGLISGGIAAVLVESLHRRRRDAEAFTDELETLYRREHAIAHTLQNSLLPTHLDSIDGVEVAARYFPGAEGAEIGGDWFDLVNREGTYTVVVGDVVGRGVQAAAVMAAMRYATHAVAGDETDPAQILSSVNALEHIRGDFVTMLCGNVDPATRSVKVASAGHPAPLLIDGPQTRFLPVCSGPPIGFLDEASYQTTNTTVPSGSVLVLFTDGLYERRGESIEVGLERLRNVASGLSGPVEGMLDELADAMLGDGVSDDTAMLGFRVS